MDLLRLALRLDGVATTLTGLAAAALAGVLDGPLGLPSGVLVGAGVFCVVFGLAVLWLSTRPVIDRRLAAGVVVVNAVWVLDNLAAPAFGLVDPTGLGLVVVLGLAAAVAGFAGLQVAGLRGAR